MIEDVVVRKRDDIDGDDKTLSWSDIYSFV